MTDQEITELTLPAQVTWDDMGEAIGLVTSITPSGCAKCTLLRGVSKTSSYAEGYQFKWGTYRMKLYEGD